MQDRISNGVETLAITCHHCGAEASVRRGREYLCPRCALATPGAEEPLVVCDVCDDESLVRVGERFLCGRCAMVVLRLSDAGDPSGGDPTEALDALGRAGEETLIAHEIEVGMLVREGSMRLVDAATAHHRALVRSLKRARDVRECVERVEAGALLFNVWAFSFDARLEELERREHLRIEQEMPTDEDTGGQAEPMRDG